MDQQRPSEDDESLLGDSRWAGILVVIVGLLWLSAVLGVIVCVF